MKINTKTSLLCTLGMAVLSYGFCNATPHTSVNNAMRTSGAYSEWLFLNKKKYEILALYGAGDLWLPHSLDSRSPEHLASSEFESPGEGYHFNNQLLVEMCIKEFHEFLASMKSVPADTLDATQQDRDQHTFNKDTFLDGLHRRLDNVSRLEASAESFYPEKYPEQIRKRRGKAFRHEFNQRIKDNDDIFEYVEQQNESVKELFRTVAFSSNKLLLQDALHQLESEVEHGRLELLDSDVEAKELTEEIARIGFRYFFWHKTVRSILYARFDEICANISAQSTPTILQSIELAYIESLIDFFTDRMLPPAPVRGTPSDRLTVSALFIFRVKSWMADAEAETSFRERSSAWAKRIKSQLIDDQDMHSLASRSSINESLGALGSSRSLRPRNTDLTPRVWETDVVE